MYTVDHIGLACAYMGCALLFGLCCAVVGTAFASVRPGLFTWWYDFLKWWKKQNRFGAWITKPLGLCHLCASGQLALWSSLYVSGWDVTLAGFAMHVLAASVAILAAAVLNGLYLLVKPEPTEGEACQMLEA